MSNHVKKQISMWQRNATHAPRITFKILRSGDNFPFSGYFTRTNLLCLDIFRYVRYKLNDKWIFVKNKYFTNYFDR